MICQTCNHDIGEHYGVQSCYLTGADAARCGVETGCKACDAASDTTAGQDAFCEWSTSIGYCTARPDGAYRTSAPHSQDPDGLRRVLCFYHGSLVVRAGGRRDGDA